jgi:hypothetical protein
VFTMVLTCGNICFLLMLLWIIKSPLGNLGGFGSIIATDILVSLFLNTVVFSFFLVLTVKPSLLHQVLQIGTYETWNSIANFFILSKLMHASVNLLENWLRSAEEGDITVCFAARLRPESSFEEQITYVVATVVIELIQSAYISMMPIPWLSTMVMCSAQIVFQNARIRSCFGSASSQFLTGDRQGYYKSDNFKFLQQILYSSVVIVCIMSMITANIIGRSMKETDQNILISQEAVQQKQSLIKVMCSDITVSLQNVIEVVSVLKRDMMEGLESDGGGGDSTADKDADIAKCMSAVLKSIDYESVLINELLLLARIEEGRFSYHCINELALKGGSLIQSPALLCILFFLFSCI